MVLPPRNARLDVALERSSRRVAESDAVLCMAGETCEMARIALERSRLLLAELERSRSEKRGESESGRRGYRRPT